MFGLCGGVSVGFAALLVAMVFRAQLREILHLLKLRLAGCERWLLRQRTELRLALKRTETQVSW